MKKPSMSEMRLQAQQLLTSLWPDIFDFTTDAPRPLKIGIIHDMLESVKERDIPLEQRDIIICLRCYTLRWPYQKMLSKGGARFDLLGNPCGEVTSEQQEYAKKVLDKFKAKQKLSKKPKASV